VANKEELLALLAEEVLGEARIPAAAGDWRDQLKALVAEIRRVLFAHADIARVAMSSGPTGPNGLAIGEAYLRILRDAGFPDHVAAWALDRISLYVTADAVERTSRKPGGDWEQLAGYLRTLPADRYPHTVALADELVSGSADERFELGLDLMLTGLASHLRA
jgi:hypothetical protein